MNLNAILEEWQKDSVIPNIDLDETSRKTASLHSKYLSYHVKAKLKLKEEQLAQKRLLKEKWLYYNGKMSKEDIERHGWPFDPFEGLKVLKSDLDRWYDSDIDIQESEKKIEYWKTVADTLKEILDNVKWRHQTIKNMIDYKKFEAGT